MKTTIPLYLIAALLVVITLQNAGVITPRQLPKTKIAGAVEVEGDVVVTNPVQIHGTIPVEINDPVVVRTSVSPLDVQVEGMVHIEKQP